MSKTLGDLSRAASQGEWSPGHLGDETTKCDCRSVVTDQMLGCVFKATNPAEVEERFRNEYPTDDESAANMRLVCELVNRFRKGILVERDLIIEECAKVAEANWHSQKVLGNIYATGVLDAGNRIASSIRSLKTSTGETA